MSRPLLILLLLYCLFGASQSIRRVLILCFRWFERTCGCDFFLLFYRREEQKLFQETSGGTFRVVEGKAVPGSPFLESKKLKKENLFFKGEVEKRQLSATADCRDSGKDAAVQSGSSENCAERALWPFNHPNYLMRYTIFNSC